MLTSLAYIFLAGLAAGIVYSLLKRRNKYVAMLVAAIVCPLVNTGIFIACMLLFFVDILASWAQGGEIFAYILTGLVVANLLPELLINVVFSPASVRITNVIEKHNNA